MSAPASPVPSLSRDKKPPSTTGANDAVVEASEATDQLLVADVDPIYAAKAAVLNSAIQQVGMGRYQWLLFVLVGFGFGADNWLPILTSLIFTPVVNEFSPKRGPYLQLGQNLGLLFGAAFWGIGSDIVGRRWAFNITFFLIGLFALLGGSSPNFAAIVTFDALWSCGVGGNLPVDSAIFLEWLPASHQYLLTILSVWWSFAQVVITAIAWGLLGDLSCSKAEASAGDCNKSNNYGWRALTFLSGGLYLVLWALRFAFPLRESPKFLMSKGRDAEAVETVHWVAKFNGTQSDVSIESFEEIDRRHAGAGGQKTGAADVAKRSLERFNFDHFKALFRTKRQGWGTCVLCGIWALIGLAYPLYNSFIPYYLSTRVTDGSSSNSITYRNSMIIALVGIPGVLFGGVLVQLPRFGRRGALALATMLTGTFILLTTTARSSNVLLGWNILYNFFSNTMYAVLYAITPEIFPTKDRGTGNGLTASCNRIFGVMSPIVAIYANLTTSAPIWVAGALFICAGLLSLLLPYEPRGKASL